MSLDPLAVQHLLDLHRRGGLAGAGGPGQQDNARFRPMGRNLFRGLLDLFLEF
ncbi:hypothetical protein SDC9_206705 [bioreactor metagenome]|uniref:Uncharacterized protein n=1 Tax=bioreactor metagenome TaxID=1076179 RepID=A0A645J5Q9_9ZZZZ